jgi:hypothetical protein
MFDPQEIIHGIMNLLRNGYDICTVICSAVGDNLISLKYFQYYLQDQHDLHQQSIFAIEFVQTEALYFNHGGFLNTNRALLL